MVLGLVAEVVAGHRGLVAIATGDGVAYELDGSRGQGRGIRHGAVEHEAPELRPQVVTFDAVHQPDGVTSGLQGRCHCDH